MATIQELVRQREELDRQIRQLQDSTRNEAISTIRSLMSEHGITVEELSRGGRKSGGEGKAGSTVAPKYRDPATGKTWTGRGLKPKWVKEALDSGKSLEDLTI